MGKWSDEHPGQKWRPSREASELLIAPTEPPQLRALGKVSSRPEELGGDIMMLPGPTIVQRKEVKDWIASIWDGRLAKEIEMMKWAERRVVLLEGTMTWTMDGVSTVSRSGFTRKQHMGIIFSLMEQGVMVINSANLSDTITVLELLQTWIEKDTHRGLSRPKPKGVWGNASSREWGIHFLQGVDSVGKELAGRIYDKYGVPILWTVGVPELSSIEGIGRLTAHRILDCLAPPDGRSKEGRDERVALGAEKGKEQPGPVPGRELRFGVKEDGSYEAE